jgi:hypothetical protein
MFFDRFDVVQAYYLFFCHYHEGQASDKYRRLSRMTRYFKPSPLLSVETLTENGRDIYEALVQKEEASRSVLNHSCTY